MDYVEVLHRFQEVFARNGAKETSEEPFFKAAEPEKLKYLTDLYDTFHYWSSIYLDDELETLRCYQVPKHIIEFYINYEPCCTPMTEAGLYLCDLERIKEENSSGAPGGILIRYGLITIATTIGGMAVCIDLNTLVEGDPQIVIVDGCDCTDVDDVENYEDIQSIYRVVASGFKEFLWKLSGDEYEDLEEIFN